MILSIFKNILMNMAPINPPTKHKSKDLESQLVNKSTPQKHLEFDKSDIVIRQAVMMTLWYIFSFGTMFTNKYILTDLDGDAGFLGETQMFFSAVFGAFKMYLPCCFFERSHHEAPRFHFFRNMAILGWMRFASVVCSLISLKYVAVSFSETIKSSAPVFTAIFSWLMLGEKQSMYVNFSLIPIMAGLALCSATELSFTMIGFVSAVMNNIMDCLQNVFSKKLLSSEQAYSPPELQFYTSAASIVVQLPLWFFYMDVHVKFKSMNNFLMSMLLINALLFYAQSLTAYGLMSLISPVTFSVSNTAKRALLIWISVLVFGNQLTPLSALGTMVVTSGVFLYQRFKANQRKWEAEQTLKGMQHDV